MNWCTGWRETCVAAAVLATCAPAWADNLTVVSLEPARHAITVPLDAEVVITFDRAVAPQTLPPGATTIMAFGRNAGVLSGAYTLENDDHTVRFTPDGPLTAGDVVTIVMSRGLTGADDAPLRDAGYVYRFRTAAAAAPRVFTELDRVSVRTDPDVRVRVYGGQACDLDGDGWVDLAIISEDASDLRVLPNPADGSGLYDAFLDPVFIGGTPSPNEAADLDLDGAIDIVTANVGGASSGVLLGNGDGTFGSVVSYPTGPGPHGLAVLDVNGDAAMDIVTANTGGNDLALIINDGAGAFGEPIRFEGGGSGEYGLTAADMNNDGIDDLLVGARDSQTIIVHLGNGDGTFTALAPRAAGDRTWMLVAGDVNGDGNMDVSNASGNSFGTILLGDGTGGLGAPAAVNAGGSIATDLGDLDGDGDLDWVLSSFGGSIWRVFTNDGTGVFSFDQSFDAVSNPACSIIVDFDNDSDLDLVLLDEIADLLYLMRNGDPAPRTGDVDGNGVVDFQDLLLLLAAWGDCEKPPAECPADVNDDGTVDFGDLLLLLAHWG